MLPFLIFLKPMILVILYIAILSVLLLFSLQNLLLWFLYMKHRGKEEPGQCTLPAAELPSVTVQLPLYNEALVAARAIGGACSLDYPKDRLQIQVLDDSTDETTAIAGSLVEEYRRQGFNIELIHRNDRCGYKAGALAGGFSSAVGDYIAVFDADFIPCRDFLHKVLPCFEGPKTGFVQTSWTHLNTFGSVVTYLQNARLESHFLVEQYPRSVAGLFIGFDGSSGVWRRECIADAGGWQADTLAEDMDLSLRAQLKGWRGIFVNTPLAEAELPDSVNSFKNQQFRWTKGSVEVLRKHWRKLLSASLPFNKKADVLVRLASNSAFPLIVLVSLLNMPVYEMLKDSEQYSSLTTIMPVFFLALISTFLTIIFINEKDLRSVLKKTVLFPAYLAGMIGLTAGNCAGFTEAVLGVRSPFNRTVKTGGRKVKSPGPAHRRSIGFAELALACYNGYWLFKLIEFGDFFSAPFQALIFIGYLVFAWNSLLK